MSALLKVYSDSGHTTEISHSANVTTALSSGVSAGATSIAVNSVTNMPAQGVVDIDTGGSLETVGYASIVGTTLYLTQPLANNHSSAAQVIQWYYSLPVGDQTYGILNDGTNATPTTYNTATYYLYNAGNQTAQNPSIATASGGVSTASGYADTLVSITNSTTGFATSVAPSNIASGGVVQFWICAEVPSGQSNAGNAQVCQINIAYATV